MATDTFESAVDPLGSPWARCLDYNLKATGGVATHTQGSDSAAGMVYVGGAAGDSQCTIGTVASATGGLLIHYSGTPPTETGYRMYLAGGTLRIYRDDGGGSNTLIQSLGSMATLSNSDVLRFWRDTGDGNKLKVSINGGAYINSESISSDTTYTSGSPGLWLWDRTMTFAEWTDGESGSTAKPFHYYAQL